MGKVLVLFFASGCTSLIYQVLWMRELGLLFGNTAHAAAVTLTAFFIGLAVGGYAWGKHAEKLNNPLRTYGYLELGVSLAALGYFFLVPAYQHIYPFVFSSFSGQENIFLAIKFILAMLFLFPAAFLIGGTLPVMSQYVARDINRMSRKVSILYAVNILGASVGALAAGFYLPILLGIQAAYLLAVGITVLIGLSAIVISRTMVLNTSHVSDQIPQQFYANEFQITGKLGLKELSILSALSGFITLALQVLWVRMFAQVLQNSVYTFSIIVVVFLVMLAVAAALANALIRSRFLPLKSLTLFILLGAVLTAITPLVFDRLTEGLQFYKNTLPWEAYILQVFGLAFLVMGPPLLCLGTIFPIILRLAEPFGGATGKTVGNMVAINTWGAAAGALTAGFFLLDQLGLWNSIYFIALLYGIVSVYLLIRLLRILGNQSFRFAAVALSLLIATTLLVGNSKELPMVHLGFVQDNQSVLETWQGSAATVAVIERQGRISEHYMVMNNTYILGGSHDRGFEVLQGSLPLSLHENPKNVFFLGMGTGISAAGALPFPLETITVTELVPEVITASETYFAPYLDGLFSDPRVKILAEDGRNYLYGTDQSFDVIIGDLFLPWKAGTSNLYSLEHFQTIRNSLTKDGIFMQWLPSAQITFTEFAIISRTMRKVFPQVTIWLGDFSPGRSIIGLLGHQRPSSISQTTAELDIIRPEYNNVALPLLAHYIGNLNAASFADYPVNRDNRPIIEYRAPIVNQNANARFTTYFSGADLIRYMVQNQQAFPHTEDAYLAELPQNIRLLSQVGLHLYRKEVLESRQQHHLTDAAYQMFKIAYEHSMEGVGSEYFRRRSPH
jgi:spermidine synthase